jgi:hypothetical protein
MTPKPDQRGTGIALCARRLRCEIATIVMKVRAIRDCGVHGPRGKTLI